MSKLRIKVTSSIIRQSMYCGFGTETWSNNHIQNITNNCAIARAIKEIWPDAVVSGEFIAFHKERNFMNLAQLPLRAQHFIRKFDMRSPEERLKLEPIEFDIDIPDYELKKIDINSLIESKTMEFIE